MNTQTTRFNRILLVVLASLLVLTLAAMNFLELSASGGQIQWWMVLVNNLILMIPLGLLFGSIYLLVTAWREHAAGLEVDTRRAKVIHWAPRIAAILIIFFISLFSLDVFEIQASPLELLGGFLMHNIPSIAMLVVLFFAWKRPEVGFAAFLIVGVLFAVFFVRSFYALSNLLLFVFPILLIAGLFYADWKWLKPQAAAGTKPANP